MSEGSEVRMQLRGPGDNGWAELAPQPDPSGTRWSAFKRTSVTAQTVVEAVATLVWESTLRIKPRGYAASKKVESDTVLGHAAMSSGMLLELCEAVDRVEKKLGTGKYEAK